VDGKGWLPAGGLAIGNSIVTRAGPRLFVKSIQWNRRAEGYAVYNFEVEALSGKEADGRNTHSYFVGKASGGAWVHNGPNHLYRLNGEAITNSQHRPGIGTGSHNGVPVKDNGYPNFSGHLYPNGTNTVIIRYTGARSTDFTRSNVAAGIQGGTPTGYTWHHVEDWNSATGNGTMQLVDEAIHGGYSHMGRVYN
jgi:hypothetical protein